MILPTITRGTRLCEVHTDTEGRCVAPYGISLTVTRPCGHTWTLGACPSHAEALVGTNTPTTCHHCGQTNPTTVTPTERLTP